ncbi:hypothetical protein ABIF64_003136 [Bradyrhizobium japonicum]
MGSLHHHRGAAQQNHHVARVELVGFAGCKAQRDISSRGRLPALLTPPPGVTPHRIVTAVIAAVAQVFEDPDQRRCSRAGLAAFAASSLSSSDAHRPSFGRVFELQMEAFLELEMLTTAFVVTYVRLHQGGSRSGISRDSIPEKLRSSLNELNGTTHRCAGPGQRAQCLLFTLRIFVVSPSGSIWRSSLKSTDLPWLPASQRAFWSPPFAHAARTAYPARGCELATVGAGPDNRRFVVRRDSGHRYEIADLAVDHAD